MITTLDISSRYSGSDISIVVNDALMEPLREMETATHWKEATLDTNGGSSAPIFVPCSGEELGARQMSLEQIPIDRVGPPRSLTVEDLLKSVTNNPPSLHQEELTMFEEFTSKYGQQGH
jgi:vacuolar protein-sorting-associated protein 4